VALTPAEQVRERLEASRAAGHPFDHAWRHAVCGLFWASGGEARTQWLAAFEQTRDEWQASYDLAEGRVHPLRTLAGVLA